MNLGSIVDLVCKKLGKLDDESVAIAKDFCRRRHEMIYARALWKDVQDIARVPVAAGQAYVTLPAEAARPLVAWDDTAGTPMDTSSLFTAALLDLNGLKGSGWAASFAEVDSVGWPYDLTLGNGFGGASTLSFLGTSDVPTEINIQGEIVFALASPQVVTMSETITAAAGTSLVNTTHEWHRIFRMTKSNQSAAFIVTQNSPSPAQAWAWSPDAETAEFARVQLMAPKSSDFTLGVLVKKRLRQMRLDADPPMIRGIDNALLALTEADMLERGRQYAKAQAKSGEGLAMIQLALDEEKNQAASDARIVPAMYQVEGTDADLYG